MTGFIVFGGFISSPISTVGVLGVVEALELAPLLDFYRTYGTCFYLFIGALDR